MGAGPPPAQIPACTASAQGLLPRVRHSIARWAKGAEYEVSGSNAVAAFACVPRDSIALTRPPKCKARRKARARSLADLRAGAQASPQSPHVALLACIHFGRLRQCHFGRVGRGEANITLQPRKNTLCRRHGSWRAFGFYEVSSQWRRRFGTAAMDHVARPVPPMRCITAIPDNKSSIDPYCAGVSPAYRMSPPSDAGARRKSSRNRDGAYNRGNSPT